MALGRSQLFHYLISIAIISGGLSCNTTDEDRKVHIVYMGSLPEGQYSLSSHHVNMLQEVVKGRPAEDLLIRSYTRSFNGFAANLTSHEKEKLARLEGVVSVFPSMTFELHTTRSWDFMDFNDDTARGNRGAESDVIIGVIDTGIWPESPSFSDKGFGPAPSKWKGACKGGKNFTCNNKLIGARYYNYSDARDDTGHGSHTASIAAGNKVKNVSFYGFAHGTARGGLPSARIAAYKVCAEDGCHSDAILAAFDDAIADGIDIITISLGPKSVLPFDKDPNAIGSFHAMEKGILTVNSVGNNGPGVGSVTSVAPWMLSVAASTTDRLFIDKVVLGNGRTLVGSSVNSFTQHGAKFPLVYGSNASTDCPAFDAEICSLMCLNKRLVEGKIVLCDPFEGDTEVHRAGGAGLIFANEEAEVNVSYVVSISALGLTQDDFDAVKVYMRTTEKPVAEILKSEVLNDSTAPVVAPFSSCGPNNIVPEIMKPDLTAPGVAILAAYSPKNPPSEEPLDVRRVNYNILSGTSMSCPHAAGVAAYVKSFHPDWSPSAIKSALMTTAWPMNPSKNAEADFSYGSGHLNPVKATDPGLVYEVLKKDYIDFLCSLGYDENKLRKMSGDNSTCPPGAGKASVRDFNYPSMTAKVSANSSFVVSFHRTVTNVGLANSTYKAKVIPSSGLNIRVEPAVLSFKSLNEKKSFNITVQGRLRSGVKMVSGSLVWSDDCHIVRTPIIVHCKKF